MKKVFAAIGIIFAFSLVGVIFEGIIPTPDVGYGADAAMRSGILSGVISVIYYGIMIYFIKMAFNSIDEQKEKKEAALKEAAFRQERAAMQCKAAEELNNKLASGHFEPYQIEALIRGTNITPEQKEALRKKYLYNKQEGSDSNSGRNN